MDKTNNRIYREACDDERSLPWAASSALAWLDNWAQHVGRCPDGKVCTCGLDAVRYELRAGLNVLQPETET